MCEILKKIIKYIKNNQPSCLVTDMLVIPKLTSLVYLSDSLVGIYLLKYTEALSFCCLKLSPCLSGVLNLFFLLFYI